MAILSRFLSFLSSLSLFAIVCPSKLTKRPRRHYCHYRAIVNRDGPVAKPGRAGSVQLRYRSCPTRICRRGFRCKIALRRELPCRQRERGTRRRFFACSLGANVAGAMQLRARDFSCRRIWLIAMVKKLADSRRERRIERVQIRRSRGQVTPGTQLTLLDAGTTTLSRSTESRERERSSPRNFRRNLGCCTVASL